MTSHDAEDDGGSDSDDKTVYFEDLTSEQIAGFLEYLSQDDPQVLEVDGERYAVMVKDVSGDP